MVNDCALTSGSRRDEHVVPPCWPVQGERPVGCGCEVGPDILGGHMPVGRDRHTQWPTVRVCHDAANGFAEIRPGPRQAHVDAGDGCAIDSEPLVEREAE